MSRIPNYVLVQVVKDAGGNKAEAARRLVKFFESGTKDGKIALENVSLMGVASALGCIDPYDVPGSVRRLGAGAVDRDKAHFNAESLYQESGTLMTNAFQTITSELIQAEVIAGYNNVEGISDKLVRTIKSTTRNNKLAGMTHLGTQFEVPENHPYPLIKFGEKYVTTKEAKYGAMIELSEEILMFDQTGMLADHARMIGEGLRQEREVLILSKVTDQGSDVYRPSGTAVALYDDSARKNLKSGVTLTDWTDIDEVLSYRALNTVDDRTDGTQRPLMGLNGPQNMLLVPETLRSTAWYIANASGQVKNTASAVHETNFGNPVAGFIGEVVSSALLDTYSTSTYYYGDFKKQFVWTELMPLQTFVQGSDSEAAFERDCVLRLKARYYGGVSARDHKWVTKCTT